MLLVVRHADTVAPAPPARSYGLSTGRTFMQYTLAQCVDAGTMTTGRLVGAALVVALAEGCPGAGYGIVGGFASLATWLIAAGLGGLGLARSLV